MHTMMVRLEAPSCREKCNVRPVRNRLEAITVTNFQLTIGINLRVFEKLKVSKRNERNERRLIGWKRERTVVRAIQVVNEDITYESLPKFGVQRNVRSHHSNNVADFSLSADSIKLDFFCEFLYFFPIYESS